MMTSMASLKGSAVGRAPEYFSTAASPACCLCVLAKVGIGSPDDLVNATLSLVSQGSCGAADVYRGDAALGPLGKAAANVLG